MKITRPDWGIDVRYLAGRDRPAVTALNRRRIAQRRRRRIAAFLRNLWRCERPESVPAIAGEKWRNFREG